MPPYLLDSGRIVALGLNIHESQSYAPQFILVHAQSATEQPPDLHPIHFWRRMCQIYQQRSQVRPKPHYHINKGNRDTIYLSTRPSRPWPASPRTISSMRALRLLTINSINMARTRLLSSFNWSMRKFRASRSLISFPTN